MGIEGTSKRVVRDMKYGLPTVHDAKFGYRPDPDVIGAVTRMSLDSDARIQRESADLPVV